MTGQVVRLWYLFAVGLPKPLACSICVDNRTVHAYIAGPLIMPMEHSEAGCCNTCVWVSSETQWWSSEEISVCTQEGSKIQSVSVQAPAVKRISIRYLSLSARSTGRHCSQLPLAMRESTNEEAATGITFQPVASLFLSYISSLRCRHQWENYPNE